MERFPESILNTLYAAFVDQPRPTTIEGCPCCVDAEEAAKLVSTPLHQIAAQELGGYASSVFLTVGSEVDFKYFLPRILEVLATESTWWPDPEVVGRAMANIPWNEYTNRQQQALVAYFDAVFEMLLAEPSPDGCELDSWLCCSSHIIPDWDRVLKRLLDHPKVLLALYEWHSEALQKRRLGNGFWEDSPRKEFFLDWMLSDEMKSVVMIEWGF